MQHVFAHGLLCISFVLHILVTFLSYLDVLLLTNLFPPIFWCIVFGIVTIYDVVWLITYFSAYNLTSRVILHYRLYIFSFISLNFFMAIIIFSISFVNLGSEPYISNNQRFKEYLSIYPILSGPILFIFFPTIATISGYMK
jgi:hypothetical protein